LNIADYDLIGIHGPLNGGKDTVCKYIQACYPDMFGHYAFAWPIKEACKLMFGFTNEQIEDRVLKEKIDEYWGFSPRYAMQKLGTEYGRDMMRKDVWIKRGELEFINNLRINRGTIITDVRFDNEADWIRSQPNSLLIYLEVPNLIRDEKYNHASEAGIVKKESDVVIQNNRFMGLSSLFAEIDKVFK
jgi:hypothetical protein